MPTPAQQNENTWRSVCSGLACWHPRLAERPHSCHNCWWHYCMDEFYFGIQFAYSDMRYWDDMWNKLTGRLRDA